VVLQECHLRYPAIFDLPQYISRMLWDEAFRNKATNRGRRRVPGRTKRISCQNKAMAPFRRPGSAHSVCTHSKLATGKVAKARADKVALQAAMKRLLARAARIEAAVLIAEQVTKTIRE
jgi:hypothetical protein